MYQDFCHTFKKEISSIRKQPLPEVNRAALYLFSSFSLSTESRFMMLLAGGLVLTATHTLLFLPANENLEEDVALFLRMT